MNISQHCIVSLGYPLVNGYYGSNGVLRPSNEWLSTDKSLTFGTNVFNMLVPNSSYGFIRLFDSTGQVESDAYTNLSELITFDSTFDEYTVGTTSATPYALKMPYVFSVMYNLPSDDLIRSIPNKEENER